MLLAFGSRRRLLPGGTTFNMPQRSRHVRTIAPVAYHRRHCLCGSGLPALQHDRHADGETAGSSRSALQATRTPGSDNDTA